MYKLFLIYLLKCKRKRFNRARGRANRKDWMAEIREAFESTLAFGEFVPPLRVGPIYIMFIPVSKQSESIGTP